MNGTIKLSSNQINKMKYALGLDRRKPGRSSYTPYRNAFFTGDDPEWNELVEQGLATKSADPFCSGNYAYFVTPAGIKQLKIDKELN